MAANFLEHSFRAFIEDASFLLTVEVFLLTVRLCTYGVGTVSRKDQTQVPDRGEP